MEFVKVSIGPYIKMNNSIVLIHCAPGLAAWTQDIESSKLRSSIGSNLLGCDENPSSKNVGTSTRFSPQLKSKKIWSLKVPFCHGAGGFFVEKADLLASTNIAVTSGSFNDIPMVKIFGNTSTQRVPGIPWKCYGNGTWLKKKTHTQKNLRSQVWVLGMFVHLSDSYR